MWGMPAVVAGWCSKTTRAATRTCPMAARARPLPRPRRFTATVPVPDTLTFTISGTRGTYRGMAPVRNYEVRLKGVWQPTAVTVTAGGRGAPRRGAAVPVAAHRRPHRGCGKLRCGGGGGGGGGGGAPVASWWWDAATMTAHARVDDVAVAAGATLVFSFDTAVQHALLHSADAALSLPLVLARALAVKQMVDAEMWRGSRPSVALNQLAATAIACSRCRAMRRRSLARSRKAPRCRPFAHGRPQCIICGWAAAADAQSPGAHCGVAAAVKARGRTLVNATDNAGLECVVAQ